MKRILIALPFVFAFGACQENSAAHMTPCQVGDYSHEQVLALKADSYADLEEAALNQLALDLLPCLGSPDPKIRDGLVYESYALWLRANLINDSTKTLLFEGVLSQLNGPDSVDGFTRPFAALDMSELARADRLSAYLTDEQRQNLVQAAARYMSGITDYRGFDDIEGWRHGVAHTADLMLQLSLNPHISNEQILVLRSALVTQIAPQNGHVYIHGEPERLARPILYMARRGAITEENWQVWFETLADPAPYGSWGDVYKSEAGLAKLHNTKAFLNAIYINASETQNENIKALLPAARAALMKLP